MQESSVFSPTAVFDMLHRYPITTLCAPPTAYRQFVLPERQRYFAAHRPKALVHCVGAGEPLNGEAIRIWRDMSGIEIRDGYGQTETTLSCANLVGAKVKPGSMGLPLPGIPLSVIDEAGEQSRVGDEGDIAIATTISEGGKTLSIFDGYIDQQTGEVTRKTRDAANGRKWYLTGDRAYRDEDGYLWFVGRNDDVINSSGYRIGESFLVVA